MKALIKYSAIHLNGEVITYNDENIKKLLDQADQQK